MSSTGKRIIKIVPYDPTWIQKFSAEAENIRKVLGDNCIDILHIGSTAIPNMAAKPVIDIMPIVKDICAVDQKDSLMQTLGYEVKGEFGMCFRRFFIKGRNARTHHVHVFEKDDAEIERHILFRDYLINNHLSAFEYMQLKKHLAVQYSNDSDAYTDGKDQFIANILKLAGFDGIRCVQVRTSNEINEYHRFYKAKTPQLAGTTLPVKDITIPNHYHFAVIKGTQIVGVAEVELTISNKAAVKFMSIDGRFKKTGYEEYLLQTLELWSSHKGCEFVNDIQ